MTKEKKAWAKAIRYAFQYLDDNPWDPLNNPKTYAIEFNGKHYPNKQVLKHAEEYLHKNFPEFLDIPRLSGGKPINDFLASKGANAVTLKDTNESGYNVDIDPSAGHTDPSMEFVSQSN